jgi:hypothetical protein
VRSSCAECCFTGVGKQRSGVQCQIRPDLSSRWLRVSAAPLLVESGRSLLSERYSLHVSKIRGRRKYEIS